MGDIDEALVRPGRCFAHLYLEELQTAEASTLLDRLCQQHPERQAGARSHLEQSRKKSFSVAEVYRIFRGAGPQAPRPQFCRPGIAGDPQRVGFGFN